MKLCVPKKLRKPVFLTLVISLIQIRSLYLLPNGVFVSKTNIKVNN